MVAIHLLRQSEGIEIDIVDPRVPGRGLAYSTTCDAHLLNVPAVRMSAFGSEPMHFLQDSLCRPRSVSCDHLTNAVRLSFDGLSVSLFLENGERISADRAVLALGNPPSRNLADPLPGYFSSPWHPSALAELDPKKPVLLVGAGLTAVDAFMALLSQGHIGRIHVLSRRGKLPLSHASYRPLPEPFHVPEKPTARSLLRDIRREVKKRASTAWRSA